MGDAENPLVPSSVVKKRKADDGLSIESFRAENPLVPTGERRTVTAKRHANKISASVGEEAAKIIEAIADNSSTSGKIAAKKALKEERLIPAEVQLVPVKGNTKVDRCIRCNTFVKKGSNHTLLECNARLARKKASNKMPKFRRAKKFRMTPKRKALIISGLKALLVYKRLNRSMESFSKWIRKNDHRLAKRTRALFHTVTSDYNKLPEEKKVEEIKRRAGL